jgi:2-dehydropantoate 2-reductase
MKIAVIGAGAIGSLVAGYLMDKKQDVVLVAHPEQFEAVTQNGLTIEGVRGKFSIRVPVKRQLDEPVDLAILATKTQDLQPAISENLGFLQRATILTVQNGIRAEEIAARRLGKNNLFASIVMFGATYLLPGKVVHNFEGDWILGRLDSGAKETLEEIRKVTSKIFPSILSEDIMAMKWFKIFLNANNCLPAILGKSMQETFKDNSICNIGLGIWREGWELTNKGGVRLISLPAFPLERIAKLISLPPEQSATIFSNIMTNLSKEPLYGSILQSIRRGRASEIDYINGEFVKLAGSTGQKAPLNEKLVEMVHRVEKDNKFFKEEELISRTKDFLN